MSIALKNGTSTKRSLQRIWRRIRKVSNKGMLRTVRDVTLMAGLVFLIGGYARGEQPDLYVAKFVRWLQLAVHDELAESWVRPIIADAFVPLLTFGGFFVSLLAMAYLFRRIPAFIDFFVLSELHRRRGHNLSSIELLVGLSMPIALTLAIVCNSIVSVYACIHFALCYAYVRVSNDLSRTNTFLNWYGRGRPVVDSGMTDDTVEDDDDVADSDDADEDVL